MQSLWKMCINPVMEPTHIDSMCIELHAGGISEWHQEVFRTRLRSINKQMFDFVDFLLYLPLFLLTHSAAVQNPL